MRPLRQIIIFFDNTLSDRYFMGMDIAQNLAANIRALRETRGISQEQLSKLSGIPRATCSHLESGSANPTLSVLSKISSAFQVSIEELVAAGRGLGKLTRAQQIPVHKRGEVLIRKLVPDVLPGMNFDRIELPNGARMTGIPHKPGTQEYLVCERGQLELTASGETWRLGAGDVLSFRGDQKHSYFNPGASVAIGYSLVLFAPA